MKKRIFAVLMTLLCVSLVFALASCGDTTTDEPTECTEHTFGEWETETYASCTQDGLRIRECTVCGFEEEEEIVGGHKWGDWQTVTELTCTQHGLKTRTCSVCEFEQRDEKEAKGHVWGTEPSKTIQKGNCTTDGIYEYKCDNCKETKTETIKATGHKWTEWGIGFDNEPFKEQATCTKQGLIGRVCLDEWCGEEEFEYTPMIPHEWEAWVVVGTCAEGATRTRGCANCDAEEEETTARGEHANVVYEGAKAPTRTEDGSTGVKKCLACDQVLEKAKTIRIVNYSSTAAPSTSSWAVVASYINDGDMNTGVTGYSDAVKQTIHTLAWSKAVGIDEITLYFSGDATGKNIGGDLKGQLANTNPNAKIIVIVYDENDEVLSRTEFNTADLTEYTIEFEEQLQAKKVEVINENNWHTYECVNIWEAEIFGIAYLTACDIAGSHSWSDWQTINGAVCNNDGTLTNGLERRTCPVCDGVEENVIVASHTFGEWDETNINCETGGTRTKTCSACGYVVSETFAAGEHVETEVQGAKEPTFEEDGSTGALVCTKCGTTIEEAKVITKLVNVTSGSTVTTTSTHWHVTAQDGKSGLQALIDGNKANGAASDPASKNCAVSLELTQAYADLSKVILTVNGSGYIPAIWVTAENTTNNNYDIWITVYDEEGKAIFTSETYNTLNKTEIEIDIDLPEGKSAKKITIERASAQATSGNYLWEVEVIAGGKVVENKAE